MRNLYIIICIGRIYCPHSATIHFRIPNHVQRFLVKSARQKMLHYLMETKGGKLSSNTLSATASQNLLLVLGKIAR
jgi:hypothetical protein